MSSIFKSGKAKVLITVGVIAVGSAFFYNRKKYGCINSKNWDWKPVGKVSHLYVYPVRSGIKVELPEIKTHFWGAQTELIADRSFMVIDSEGKVCDLKSFPKLIDITPGIDDEGRALKLSAPKMSDVIVDVHILQSSEKKVDREVINGTSKISTIDCGDTVSDWITEALGSGNQKLRLVYAQDESCKGRRFRENFKQIREMGKGGSDSPNHFNRLSVINETSIKDLTNRLDNAQDGTNFKPNIIITDTMPNDEINWKFLKIGETTILRSCHKKPSTESKEKITSQNSALLNVVKSGSVKLGDQVSVVYHDKKENQPEHQS